MDREITIEERRRATFKKVGTVAVAILVVCFLFAATIEWLRPSIRRRDIQTARVGRGTVDATIQATGVVVPAFEQVVSSPVDARVVRIVRRAGDRVKPGDELIGLDTSATQLEAARVEDRIIQKQSEMSRSKLALEETAASLAAQVEQKKLDREILQFKAEQTASLFREGLVSSQDNLAAATALRKVDIELAQLRDALARAHRTSQSQLAATASELRTLQRESEDSRHQLALAMMRSDREGVLTSVIQETGATVRRGDVIARIADLSSYRISATVSDVHASSIAAGMRTRVKVDGSTWLDGSISSVEPRVDEGSAKFWVTLNEPSHPKLRHNARLDVHVITGSHSGVLSVHRGALGRGNVEDVFVVRGDELVAVPVRWGLAGEERIEISSGLREGDEVVISSMSDYEGSKRLKLK